MRTLRDGVFIVLAAMAALGASAGSASALGGLEALDNSYITLRQERPGLPDDQFYQIMKFVLAQGRTINPLTEPVVVTLSSDFCQGPFSQLTIPPGNFESRVGGKIAFFDGVVIDDLTGAPVEASIRITRDRGFFKAAFDFKNADYVCLEGTVDVFVSTRLVVGDDALDGGICYKRLNDGDLFWPASFAGICGP